MTDPLQCTFDDARRQHLRDGIAMSTAAKIAWFEEMVTLAVRFGAVDRLRDRPERSVVDKTDSAPLMKTINTHSLGQISHALYDVGDEYRRDM